MILWERILYITSITAFAVGCFFYRTQFQQMAQDCEIAKTENARMAVSIDNGAFELQTAQREIAMLKDRDFKKYVLKPMGNRLTSLVTTVYQSKKDGLVYIIVNAPFSIDRDKQYKLWGVKNGKYVHGGTFQVGLTGLQKLSHMDLMDTFTVTIEPMGKVLEPTSNPILGAQVIG